MILQKLGPNDPRLQQILELIQMSYAFMAGRIDPPSSMYKLNIDDISNQCRIGEVWSVGDPPQGCVFLTFNENALYLGKIAVLESVRREGLAKKLIEVAELRARSRNLKHLELQVRIELIENHEAFGSLGFLKISEGSHAGYDRSTFIVMRKDV